MSTAMTIRLDEATKARLDALAESTNRSSSFLAAEAIREYIELNEWQVTQIHTALAEADQGDFASPAEVESMRNKWSANAD
jgi:RHH-type rel operon transcriptional repressor/antitoxin RelB